MPAQPGTAAPDSSLAVAIAVGVLVLCFCIVAALLGARWFLRREDDADQPQSNDSPSSTATMSEYGRVDVSTAAGATTDYVQLPALPSSKSNYNLYTPKTLSNEYDNVNSHLVAQTNSSSGSDSSGRRHKRRSKRRSDKLGRSPRRSPRGYDIVPSEYDDINVAL